MGTFREGEVWGALLCTQADVVSNIVISFVLHTPTSHIIHKQKSQPLAQITTLG